jgi:hypothetical protein
MKTDLLSLGLILKLTFLNLQYASRINPANKDLINTIIGTGKSIYFPNTPDVLMNSTAKLSSKMLATVFLDFNGDPCC